MSQIIPLAAEARPYVELLQRHTAAHPLFISTLVLIPALIMTSYLLRLYEKAGPKQAETAVASDKTPVLKSNKRPFGLWEPSNFKWPKATPYPDWSIDSTKPLPYRPFRYGPKHYVSMGIRNTKHEEWFEIDNEFPRFYHEKMARITDRGSKCCQTLPEALPAANELLEELVEYLPSRYPTLYERVDTGIRNLWSGEVVDCFSSPLAEDPMQIVGRLTQDDVAILIERSDGIYYLVAGAILLAGFWRLEDKVGMPLWEIHTSAGVPHYEERLEKSMDNFFRRVKPEDFITRNNYSIQLDENLPWSTSVGNEDSTDLGWHHADPDAPIEKVHLRSERQSIRRLPRTGAIVFTIHTYFNPIPELAQEDHVPGRLASALRSWDDVMSEYKGAHTYKDKVLEFLDDAHQRQVAKGLDTEGEMQRRRYPW